MFKHPVLAKHHNDQKTFGQRAADRMKRALATWTALIGMSIFIFLWMTANSWIFHRVWDPYPWILLNLCLSTLAGLQCFVLLIANKRGEEMAAELAEHTFENTQKLHELLSENTSLTEQVKNDTGLLNELHRHVTAISDYLGLHAGDFNPPD